MRKFPKIVLTIKREMFLLSVLSFLLVSLSITGLFLALLYQNNLNSARVSLRECNSQVLTFTEGLFRENAAVIKILATDDTVIQAGNGSEESLLSRFDAVLDNNENLTYAYAGYADGSLHIRDYHPPLDYDVTTRPWYQAAVAADGVTRLVYRDAATDVWLFSQCMKLTDRAGRVVGALAMDCSNQSIARQLSTKYRYDSQRSYIIDENGTVLIHPSDYQINRTLRDYVSAEDWQAILSGGEYAEYRVDEVRTMAYFARIPNTEFIIATAIDANEVVSPILQNLAFLLGIMLVASLVLGLAMSRVYLHRFAQPLRTLSARIRALAAGVPFEEAHLGTSNAEMQDIAHDIEVIVTNIAQREEQRKAAEYLSFHDSMTGLYNRRYFEEEMQRLDVPDSYPLCFVSCDINGLKLVNDVFGHVHGDELLRTVAGCLQKAVSVDDVLARVGGDEFHVLLPRTPGVRGEKFIARVQAALSSLQCGAEASVSMGYAVKTSPRESIPELLRLADKMLYERKIVESVQMKQHTVDNTIATAQREGLVCPPSDLELRLLRFFAYTTQTDADALLESYHLRKLGLCSWLLPMSDSDAACLHHTEASYRLLSSVERYRNVAACVLHYSERWDGSGGPSGLAGADIPMLSRILAVTEAYAEQGGPHVREYSGVWYDEQLVAALERFEP